MGGKVIYSFLSFINFCISFFVVEDDVEIEENDDDRSDCSEVSDNDFKESWDWTKSLDPQTFSQSSHPTFETNEVDLSNFDFDDEDGYSNELDTPNESDDEGPPKFRFSHFKVPENGERITNQLRESTRRTQAQMDYLFKFLGCRTHIFWLWRSSSTNG